MDSKPRKEGEEHRTTTQTQQAKPIKEKQQIKADVSVDRTKEVEGTKPKAKCPRCGADNYAGLCQSCFGGLDFR